MRESRASVDVARLQRMSIAGVRILEGRIAGQSDLASAPANRVALGLGELFCGAGGLALGALLANLRAQRVEYSIAPVWANDYDEDAWTAKRVETLQKLQDIVRNTR